MPDSPLSDFKWEDVFEDSSPKNRGKKSSKNSSPSSFSFPDVHEEANTVSFYAENPKHTRYNDAKNSIHSKMFDPSMKQSTNPLLRQKYPKVSPTILKNSATIENLKKQINDECLTLRRYNALLEKRGLHGHELPQKPSYTNLDTNQIIKKQNEYISNLKSYIKKCSHEMLDSNVNHLVKNAITEARRRKHSGGKSKQRETRRRRRTLHRKG